MSTWIKIVLEMLAKLIETILEAFVNGDLSAAQKAKVKTMAAKLGKIG